LVIGFILFPTEQSMEEMSSVGSTSNTSQDDETAFLIAPLKNKQQQSKLSIQEQTTSKEVRSTRGARIMSTIASPVISFWEFLIKGNFVQVEYSFIHLFIDIYICLFILLFFILFLFLFIYLFVYLFIIAIIFEFCLNSKNVHSQLAVAFIVGGAFNASVKSFVEDVIMPPMYFVLYLFAEFI
jgi:hypothetical protein